jgi:uncharacterized membrane protein YhaH (DUF805 family)
MALSECPECGGNVSDLAAACPHCGYPTSTTSGNPPPPPVVETIPWDEKPLNEEAEGILLGRYPNNPTKRMSARREVWHRIATEPSDANSSVSGSLKRWDWGRMIDFTSRTTRSEFWVVQISAVLLMACAMAVGVAVEGIWGSDAGLFLIVGGFVIFLLWLWISFGSAVNRAHDMGRSGATALLLVLPLAGVIALIWIGVTPSEVTTNEWGPPIRDRP